MPVVETKSVSFRDLVGRLPTDEGLHGLYPYPARLLRQIPRFLLSRDEVVNGIRTVIDPFCGSGTVLLEAQRAGMRGVGFDQNPVAALVSRVKTSPPDSHAFFDAAQLVMTAAQSVVANDTADVAGISPVVKRWVDPTALAPLAALRDAVADFGGEEELISSLEVLLALTMRTVAKTDPRIPVPVRPRSLDARPESPWESWEAHSERMRRRFKTSSASQSVVVYETDARSHEAWERVHDTGPTLLFTSPPYGTAQKYLRSTSLEHALLAGSSFEGTAHFQQSSVGRERLRKAENDALREWRAPAEIQRWIDRISESSVSRARAYQAYFKDMETVLQCARATSLNCSRMILVTGTNHVAGVDLPTYQLLRTLAEEAGFTMTTSLRDEIRGRTLLTNRRSSGGPATHEWVEVFERNG